MKTVQERVLKMIGDQLGLIGEGEVKPESTTGELGADSLDRVEIVMNLEDMFNIEISDDEADAITTVQGYIDIVTRKAAA